MSLSQACTLCKEESSCKVWWGSALQVWETERWPARLEGEWQRSVRGWKSRPSPHHSGPHRLKKEVWDVLYEQYDLKKLKEGRVRWVWMGEVSRSGSTDSQMQRYRVMKKRGTIVKIQERGSPLESCMEMNMMTKAVFCTKRKRKAS